MGSSAAIFVNSARLIAGETSTGWTCDESRNISDLKSQLGGPVGQKIFKSAQLFPG